MQVSEGASVRVCGLNFMGATDSAIYGEANSAITISDSSFTDNRAGESPLRVKAHTPCEMRAQT